MTCSTPRLMIAAPGSGSGKTTVTAALLAAMAMEGMTPAPFKCGPDYIDPMFHRAACGREGYNLDLFLMGKEGCRRTFAQKSAGADMAVLEGVMGCYDGIGMTERASSWELARVLCCPIVLAVRSAGTALTLAAQLRGLREFCPGQRDCGSHFYRASAGALSRLSGNAPGEGGAGLLRVSAPPAGVCAGEPPSGAGASG